jgi:hypothetical protein
VSDHTPLFDLLLSASSKLERRKKMPRRKQSSRTTYRPHSDSHDATYFGLGSRTLCGSGNQPYLDTQTSAILAEAAYTFGSSYGTKNQRKEDTNDRISATGFKVLPRFSGPQLTVFAKTLPGGGIHVHVAHKGKRTSNMAEMRELISDARQLMASPHYEQFTERMKVTEAAVNAYNPQIFTMSGHSFGGATMSDTIVRSGLIRKRLDQADSFNAASSPFFKRVEQENLSPEEVVELAEKVTHHRQEHDLMSKGLNMDGGPPGAVNTYNLESATGDDNLTDAEKKLLSTRKRALEANDIARFSQDPSLKVQRTDLEGSGKSAAPVGGMSDAALLDGIEAIIKARGIMQGEGVRKSLMANITGPSLRADQTRLTSERTSGDTGSNVERRSRAASSINQELNPSASSQPIDAALGAVSVGADLASDESAKHKSGVVGGYVGTEAGGQIGADIGGMVGLPNVGGQIGSKFGGYWGKKAGRVGFSSRKKIGSRLKKAF